MNSTSMFAGEVAGGVAVVSRPTQPGLVARVLGALTRARELQAQREVNRYLARQPDRLLRDIGLDATAIAELRCTCRD